MHGTIDDVIIGSITSSSMGVVEIEFCPDTESNLDNRSKLSSGGQEHQPVYDAQSLAHSMLTCGPACYAGLLDGAAMGLCVACS
jgi:hypothetical protein